MKRLIRFTASWCAPCKQLASALESVNSGLPVEVYDIDVHSEYAVDFGVRSVPTLILLEGNDEIKRLVGTQRPELLKQWLEN